MDRRRLTLLGDGLWLLLAGIASSLYCATSAPQIGPTFDEPLYVRYGLERWHTGSTYQLMRVGTMPLPVDVAALPVAVWEHLRGERFDVDADLARILPVARLGTLAFWWVLLVYGWLIARRLGGAWAGRLAVAVLATEPNLLAHAGLATTDLALAAMTLVCCFHYRLGRDKRWLPRVGVPALCYAAAILAKASGMVFVPICMVAIEFECVWSESATTKSRPRFFESLRSVFARRKCLDFLVLFFIAQTLVFIYCGSDWRPHEKMAAAAHALPESPWRPPAIWAAEHFRVFNNAGVALSRQMMHNAQGHSSFLLGDTAPRAFWYYFPAALSIKTTIPVLLLLAGLLVIHPRALWNWPMLAAACLLLFSLTCRVQIGIRFFLPLIALAGIGLSIAWSRAEIWSRVSTPPYPPRFGGSRGGSRRRANLRLTLLSVASLVFVFWLAIESAIAWPNALCFTNGIWGPRDQGYKLLSDSNYDWGQGIPELAEWAQRHQTPEIAIWYFGADPAARRPPFHSVSLIGVSPTNIRSASGCRYLAVGTTILYGGYVNPAEAPALDWLRNRPIADRTQTFLIFDLEADDLKAIATLSN